MARLEWRQPSSHQAAKGVSFLPLILHFETSRDRALPCHGTPARLGSEFALCEVAQAYNGDIEA